MKSPLTKTMIHTLEIGLVCALILGVMWAGSQLGVFTIEQVKDAALPLLLTTLGAAVPKYVRESDALPIRDYVNK